MRRLFPIGLVLSLTLAMPAHAKEVISAKVCGAARCATSRDRDLIAALAEGGDPVDPPETVSPFFRVRLEIGEESGRVMERFWTHFVPRGELVRGSDGTWMPATRAYTSALKKVVDPDMEAYPASRLSELLAGDRPVPVYEAQVSEVVHAPPATSGGGLNTILAIGLAAAGTFVVLAVATSRAARAGGP